MAILRKSALALAAVICFGITVPVLAQDKAASDVKAAQNTVKEIQALGAQIKARQAGQTAGTAVTPVAAPEVSSTATAPARGKANGKKANAKKPAGTGTTAPKKKKKTP